jgi:CPA2 family monovalent cation:H+ antiporter-2
MTHLPVLIQDLGIILITAATVALICKRFHQPIVLGYLIAGFLVGSHFSLFPYIAEKENIQTWAEIGVIFLLFNLGLEFSFKKLKQVGWKSIVTAVFEISSMMCIGYTVGQWLGWSKINCLFLGGVLSISSTTIIARVFEEYGFKGRKFVSLVFGVLIIEDLAAVLLLVFLSTAAVTQSFSGMSLFISTLKLFFFLIIWFVVGIYFLPILLKNIKKLLTDETTLILSIGLCLLMVIIATKTGFSAALGAFVMGSLLAETMDSSKIEQLLSPVKDLFAAIFFVSVGMMIDPSVFVNHLGEIILITTVLVIGKTLSVTTGSLLSGQSIRHAVQTGTSLGQIGEFSFIIATLGLTLNVTNDILYPIVVGVSAITAFTTPYLIRLSEPLNAWLHKNIPAEIQKRVQKYQTDVYNSSSQHVAKYFWKFYGMKMLLNGAVVLAITLGVKTYILPVLYEKNGYNPWISLMTTVSVLIITAPFLWALMRSKPSKTVVQADFKLAQLIETAFFAVRLLIGIFLIGFIIWEFASFTAASVFIFFGLFTVAILFIGFSEPFYRKIERRFLENLGDKEDRRKPRLAPWDATLTEYIISPNSQLVGKTLQGSSIKEKYGITIALMERGVKKIIAPGRDELLMPFDRLFLIGTEDQLAKIRSEIEIKVEDIYEDENLDVYGLESFILTNHSPFVNKTIRECGLREYVGGLIVGIERNGQRTLSPDSSTILVTDDLVWIVGDKTKIHMVKAKYC